MAVTMIFLCYAHHHFTPHIICFSLIQQWLRSQTGFSRKNLNFLLNCTLDIPFVFLRHLQLYKERWPRYAFLKQALVSHTKIYLLFLKFFKSFFSNRETEIKLGNWTVGAFLYQLISSNVTVHGKRTLILAEVKKGYFPIIDQTLI